MTMEPLSEDDRNLQGMSLEELEAAWDLWFDLAQHTNDFDPPYTHGVFQTAGEEHGAGPRGEPAGGGSGARQAPGGER
jgi:hypothetical protein